MMAMFQPRKLKPHKDELPANAHLCNHDEKLSLSFAGGAVLSFFNVGIASWLIKNIPASRIGNIFGVSGGALCAVWLICSKDADDFNFITREYVREWEAQVERIGGRLALRRSLSYHRSLLERHLPENAHELCSDKLTIALTRVSGFKWERVSAYESKNHLIQVLIAAMTIPLVNSLAPTKVNESRYIDGGFISNQLICCSKTLVCSPFQALNPPWDKKRTTVDSSIQGPHPFWKALNAYTDIRQQVELGERSAQQYFDAPTHIHWKIAPHQLKKPQATPRLVALKV